MAASSSANAQQRYNWTGFSVYAGIGAAKLDADVSVHDESIYNARAGCPYTPEPVTATGYCYTDDWRNRLRRVESFYSANSDSDFSVLGTVGIAADVEFTPGFVIGAFADFDKSNASVDFLGSSSVTEGRNMRPRTYGTSIEGELKHDYSFSIGGRLGMLTPNRQGMIYLLAAYTQAHMQNSSATIGHSVHIPDIGTGFARPVSVALPTQFDGLTLGVGGELKITNAWSLKAEGRYTNLRAKSVSYSSGRLRKNRTDLGVHHDYYDNRQSVIIVDSASRGTIDVDPDIYSARVVLSYSFN